MTSVAETFSSPRFQRYLLWFGVAVLAIGATALVVVILGENSDAPTKSDAGSPARSVPLRNSQGVPIKTYAQLDPQIRAAVKTFIGSAVARRHVDRSWDVVGPSLKAGYTRSQWA